MKRRFSWVSLLMVGALTGCPQPQTTGTPPADPTPSPTPTPTSTPTAPPEQGSATYEITVWELAFDGNGQVRTEADATDALVVLPLIEPQNYFLRMDEAPLGAMPSYRTSGLRSPLLRSFAQAPGIRAAKPTPGALAPRASEVPEGYGEQATFRVNGETVTANRVHAGTHCLVYVDTRDQASSAALVTAIASAFETTLYPKASQLLGDVPGGRKEDGFNRGDNRVVLLVSRVGTEMGAAFYPTDLFTSWGDGNFGKVLHVNAALSAPEVLPVLAHELGGMIFFMQRAEAYSRKIGNALPVGTDLSYVFDSEPWEDYWLHPLISLLTAQACGYNADSGNREALLAIGKYLDLPNMYQLDMNALEGLYDSNMGQTLLFGAYLHGQKPTFARTLGNTEALGFEALESAMGRDFPGLFRDFSLATVLDGLAGVPARYTIPFVNLHHTYALDGKPFPFTGAGAPTAGTVSSHGALQTVLLRGHFPQGKVRLGLSAGSARKASLVLFRPSATARFTEE